MTNGAAPPSPPKSAATSPEQHPTDISEDAIAAMEGLRIDNEKQDQFNEVHRTYLRFCLPFFPEFQPAVGQSML